MLLDERPALDKEINPVRRDPYKYPYNIIYRDPYNPYKSIYHAFIPFHVLVRVLPFNTELKIPFSIRWSFYIYRCMWHVLSAYPRENPGLQQLNDNSIPIKIKCL